MIHMDMLLFHCRGDLAIRDINADEAQTEGYSSPAKHDGGGYVIQSSYSFVELI